MPRVLVFALLLLAAGACERQQPDNTANVAADADGGIALDPESARMFAIMPRIRLDIPTPQSPAEGWIMRNVISVAETPEGEFFDAEDCREPAGLDVSFYWHGVHGNAIATTAEFRPTIGTPGPLTVTRYDVCVTTDTDPATKCTGRPGEEIYAVPAPTTYYRPPNGLPRDPFYLADITWQVRACRSSPAVCGAWSQPIGFSWGFAGPWPLHEETFVLADGISLGLQLHFCNVDKSAAAASGTDHIICMTKEANFSPNPAAECMNAFRRGDPDFTIRLSSNSPEKILSETDLPSPDGRNVWTVGACNSNVSDDLCGWSQVPPRIFDSPF